LNDLNESLEEIDVAAMLNMIEQETNDLQANESIQDEIEQLEAQMKGQ